MWSFDYIKFSFNKVERPQIEIEKEIEELDKDSLSRLDDQIRMADWIYKERLKQRKQDIINMMPTI
jgi:hypothetical protein